MISDDTIEAIKNSVKIEEIVGETVALKKRGASYIGLCPFHDEKTPSFNVTPAKGIYKCFGCGKAGTAITFLMEHKNKTYPEAIRFLADKYNIAIQEVNDEGHEAQRKSAKDYAAATKFALDNYVKELRSHPELIRQTLCTREIREETLLDFQIGFAPDSWKFLTEKIINNELFEPAKKLGLIRRNDEKEMNYDFFRNRVMVPIFNGSGSCVGFGGRKFDDGKKDNPKYINSSECDGFFEKRKVLFGLNLALVAIKKRGFAVLVEGYFDVISLHDKGVENSVGTMGTAFTEEQARLLAKYTRRVYIMRDKDAAGYKSTFQAIQICLVNDIIPYVIPLQAEGDDPDSFARQFVTFGIATRQALGWCTLTDYIEDMQIDGIQWFISETLKPVTDRASKEEAEDKITELLLAIDRQTTREFYLSYLKKSHNLDLKKQVAAALKERLKKQKEQKAETGKLPDWALEKLEELEQNGFVTMEDETQPEEWGYYFRRYQTTLEKVSNFTFKIIMHVRDDEEDKRILEVNNGVKKQYIDIPSKSLLNLEQFVSTIFTLEGNILYWGDRKQLLTLLGVIGSECQVAHELKTLGYQREGFFAFSNGIVDASGTFVPMDDYGLVQFNGLNYYSPSASTIYNNRREDNDPYENDRYLIYVLTQVTFPQWAQQFAKVYYENNSGTIGIASVFVALFKDIIFKVDNNSPLLSAYGETGTGKSKYIESLSNFFFKGLLPLNLFHCTDFALANRFTRYTNVLVWGDEFNDQTLKEERFEAAKASYDGNIRERGKGGSKNKTEILKARSMLMLTGQYLSTKDDMAAINRCIVVPFEKREGERARTVEEIKEYEILKNWEKEGLSSLIVELLKHRSEFEQQYAKSFMVNFGQLRQAISEQGAEYIDRVVRNYNALVTCWQFFSSKYELPVSSESFFKIISEEVIRLCSLINNNKSLSDFWNTVIYLLEQGDIREGFHLKIETHDSVTVTEEVGGDGKRKTVTHTFSKCRNLLFIRLTTIHKLYAEAYRRQNGKNGLTRSTLELYMRRTNGFIGNNSTGWFTDKDGQKMNTSSYVFDYDQLGVALVTMKPIKDYTAESVRYQDDMPQEPSASIPDDPEDVPF